MASQGYGHCRYDKSRAEFQSAVFLRNCHKFEIENQDVVEKRVVWLNMKKKQFLEEIASHDKT